jgi:hypothetical protein
MGLFDEIRKKSNVSFRSANPEDLKQFCLLGAPEDAISFFKEHGPSEDCAEINKVRLLPIEEILALAENSDFVLAADIQLQALGYLVFATTVYGDSYCFVTKGAANADSAPVVLLAHDWELDESTCARGWQNWRNLWRITFTIFFRRGWKQGSTCIHCMQSGSGSVLT